MWSTRLSLCALLSMGALCACSSDPPSGKGAGGRGDTAALEDSGDADETGLPEDTAPAGPGPFADAVAEFKPGEGAGYGQDGFPDVVLGPPEGGGESGSLDVLSLGREGVIVLEFTDIGLVDGPGPDLLVFENPFPGWYEPGAVAVSEDGVDWQEWPCDPSDVEGLYPGCAGVGLVWSSSASGVDPTDPAVAGGDAFDLAEVGLTRARFVRIRDGGTSDYAGVSGGFDLDAVAVVNGETLAPG